MSGMDRLTDELLEHYLRYGSYYEKSMARELLAHRRASQAAPAPSDGLREAAATILAVLEDPDSLPYEHHPDWQAIYNAMTADHNESVEISGDSWHDWPSILIAGLEVMAQDSAALAKIAQGA